MAALRRPGGIYSLPDSLRRVQCVRMFRLLIALVLITSAALAERPAKWAQPVKTTTVKNLNRVTPRLYRSAQPDAAGMRELGKLGVKTVVTLRDFNDDDKEARGTKLRLREVDMSAWHIKDEEVAQVLALLRKREDGPFLIHCHHGSDRTGVACAADVMRTSAMSRRNIPAHCTRRRLSGRL